MDSKKKLEYAKVRSKPFSPLTRVFHLIPTKNKVLFNYNRKIKLMIS